MPGRKPRILTTIQRALESKPGEEWQRELALAYAADLDIKANAAMGAQLRNLMEEIGAASAGQSKDVGDELAAARSARRAAARQVGS
jgi:hypothetical protein